MKGDKRSLRFKFIAMLLVLSMMAPALTSVLAVYEYQPPEVYEYQTSEVYEQPIAISNDDVFSEIMAMASSQNQLTQQDVLVMLLYLAGMRTSQFAGGPPNYPFFNYNEFARAAGFFNNWEFVPEQVMTAQTIPAMTYAMQEAFIGLRDALSAVPRVPYFVNGMAVPIFEFGNSTIRDTSGDGILRFVVYVETEFDTDGDGQRDLIKVLVQLPNSALQGAEFATIFEARPYIEGTVGQNPSPLHRARGDEFLAANPDFSHSSLWASPAPRAAQGSVPRGTAGVAHMVDNAVTSDWFYQFTTQTLGGGTYSAIYNLNPPVPGSQVRYEYENLNWYDYFLVRGFAVVAAHGPAGLNSQGFATMGADVEIAAFKSVIEWLTGNGRAFTNKTDNIEVFADWSNGNVGMTGRSYAGTTQFGLATTGVEGLKTIVPVAGIASWYEYTNFQGTFGTWEYAVGLAWHCNSRLGAWTTQARIAGGDGTTLNWAGVPGNTFLRYMGYSQLMRREEAALAGNYGEFWARRDYTRDGWFRDWGPSQIQTPMFIIHGLNDDNVRTKQSEMMYRAARSAGVPVKLMWNQGEHMTPTFPFANANPYLNVGNTGAAAHRPFVMYCGEYTFDELLNLWFSHWLYGVDNNVLERIPNVLVHNNSTGEWDSYDSWHDTETLTITGADFRVNTASDGVSGNTFLSPAISFSVPEEFLIFDEPDMDSETMARPSVDDTCEPLFAPFATAAANTSDNNRFITINSANGLTHGNAAIDTGAPGTALNWWNNLNYSTAGSAIYYITLTEDVTVKGVVEVNFRAAFESLGTYARDNLRVHAKLVEVAAPGTTINFFGTPRVGATPARVLAPAATLPGNNNWAAWQGGGARNSNMVEFAQSTGTFREIAKGWMDLTNPGAGFESYTAGIESQIDPRANIGVYHNYTIYMQPGVHTARAGNRLVLLITTGGSQPGAITGPSANRAQGIDRFSFTLDNNYTQIDIPIAPLGPRFGFNIFNNGPGGSPSTPNASLADAGIIRMWTQLDGVNTPVPYPNLTITAQFPDGTSAMEFVRIGRVWVEGQGWQNYFSTIDVLKGDGDWEYINFSMTAFSQTVNVVLANDRFVPHIPSIIASIAETAANAHFEANRPTVVNRPNVTNMGNGILDAVRAALAASDFADVTVSWIAPFAGEQATTWDPSIMAGTLQLIWESERIFVPLFWEVQFLTPLTPPEWFLNRSVVPRVPDDDPIVAHRGLAAPRDQFERDIFEAITVAGPKMWGTPNEQYVSRYLFDRFTEVAAIANANLPAGGRQASAHLVAIPLNHSNPGAPPNIDFTGVSNHAPSGADIDPHGAFCRHESATAARFSFIDDPLGQYVWGTGASRTVHGQRVADYYGLWWPITGPSPGLANSRLNFQGAGSATLVDLGTFPFLTVPAGTTGDIAVIVRFGTAHLQMEHQLLPVIERLNENPDFNIRLVVLARHRAGENPRITIPESRWFDMGRRFWSGSVVQLNNRPQDKPGNTDNELNRAMYNALPGHEEFGERFPFVLVSHAHLTEIEDRNARGLLDTIERYERTHMYSPLLILPATENPDEPELVLFMASHMDSVAHSDGIGDSTGGALTMLRAAREVAGIDRGRTEIWILPYSGHEEGMNAGTEVYSRGGSAAFASMVLDSQVRRMRSHTTASGISFADISIVYSFDMTNCIDPAGLTSQVFRTTAGFGGATRPGWSRNIIGPFATAANTPSNLGAAIFLNGSRAMNDPALWRTTEGQRIGRTTLTGGGSGEAAAMARDLGTMGGGGSNGIGLFYHNAWDSMEYNYCYYTMRHSSEVFRRGLLWAFENEASRVARFTVDRNTRTLTLANAAQLFRIYDRIEGHLLIGTYAAIPFYFDRPSATFQIPASATVEATTPIAIADMVGFGASPAAANVISINHATGEFTTGAYTRFYARMVPNAEFAPTAEHLHARLAGTRIHTGMIGRSGSYTVNNPFVMVGDVGYISNRVFANLIGGEQSFFTAGMNPMNHRGEVIVRGQHADGDLVTVRVPEWRERNQFWGYNAFGPMVTYFGWWTVETPPPIYAYITKGAGATQRVMINTPTTGVHVQDTQAYLPLSLLAEAFGYNLIPHVDGGYVLEPQIVAVPELTYTLFAEDWRPSINIRFFLNGTPADIPLANMELVVDGVVIDNIRDFTLNIAGWQTSQTTVFICKVRHNWQHLTFTVTYQGQTLFFEFTNSMFVPPEPAPVLTTTIFAEDWRTTINIRFFLDGALASLPLTDIELIADGVPVANIRDFTVNVAGWQTETSAIFINKLAPTWQNLIVNITAYGQTLTYQFVNNMFVPSVPEAIVEDVVED